MLTFAAPSALKNSNSAKFPRGRRPVSTIPAERDRHLAALFLRRTYGLPTRVLALMSEVTERTVRNWDRLVRTYPEAESRASLNEWAAEHPEVIRGTIGLDD